ncbi:TPA: hypothetical protein DCZ39_04245 [Patescibacteria group bacterium]|nr:hypothetical protein [Candidatus Gracilibacteria bacterium]
MILIAMAFVGYAITYFRHIDILRFFIVAFVLNALVVYASLSTIKKIAKGLTVEDTIDPVL